MRRYRRDTDDATLATLFRASLTDEQIAEQMHVALSAVTDARQRLSLFRANPRKKPAETEPPHAPVSTCPIARARRELGGRISEKNGSYWLDGRCPVSARDMVREANRVLVKASREQVGPPHWRVP